MPKDRICSRQPTGVCHNSVFVVNLNRLQDSSDIRADDNGVWRRNGAPIAFVSLHVKVGGKIKVSRRTRMKPHSLLQIIKNILYSFIFT